MKISNILYGIGGLVIGAVGGFLVSDYIYTKKYNALVDEIDNLEESQQQLEHFIQDIESVKGQKLDELGEVEEDIPESKNMKVLYNQVPKKEEVPEENDISLPDGAEEWLKKHRNDPPYISMDLNNRQDLIRYGFEIEELHYYQNNDILLDNENEPFDEQDVSELLGDCLSEEGWDTNDEEELYVVNNREQIIYLIQKHQESAPEIEA